ncbi:MAG: type I-E CRISPR-associated protein Cas7/Cse4/CasC [Deltaproteobacteria bacterium]|nr:type I-E CRISPR-associated protein Cas7/Cse4/CasC [Deltaproteobacteria bacterium]
MFVELHLLQNFAPSCLNRDDTNSPKDCEFGGYRRARISSQCIKRAIRRHFQHHLLLPPEHLAKRTKRLVDLLTERLVKAGKDRPTASGVAEVALRSCGLGIRADGKTEYLVFLGEGETASLAEACEKHWEALTAVIVREDEAEADKRARKKAHKAAVPEEFRKEVQALLNGGKAADLALFGRMLADLPDKNIDAACQVAHALSTNQVSMEFDFYTAVDDLQPQEEPGAGMMGTVEFNSACYYRYANLDFDQLTQNLGGDTDLARKTVEAFLMATVQAVPTGKQTSMAAQNPPSLVLAVVREHGLWNLANAFVDPVRPGRDGSLVQKSAQALEDYWARLAAVFGEEGIKVKTALAVDCTLAQLQDCQVGSLNELVQKVINALPRQAQPPEKEAP